MDVEWDNGNSNSYRYGKDSALDIKVRQRVLHLQELIFLFINRQIFFARAIGLNTSRDAEKIGEYQMILSSSRTLRFTFAQLVFIPIPSKLLKLIKLNIVNRLTIS